MEKVTTMFLTLCLKYCPSGHKQRKLPREDLLQYEELICDSYENNYFHML